MNKPGWFARLRSGLFGDPVEHMKCDTLFEMVKSLMATSETQRKLIDIQDQKIVAMDRLLNVLADQIVKSGSKRPSTNTYSAP